MTTLTEWVLVALITTSSGQIATVTIPGFKTQTECDTAGIILSLRYPGRSVLPTCLEQKKEVYVLVPTPIGDIAP